MKINFGFNRRSFRSRVIAGVSLATAAIFLAGCVSINRLREAQDSFSRAAAAENSARFEGNPADAAASLASVPAGYASALLSLNKLEPKDRQSLQQDGLWGTALTLKALCQWRLGQYSQAISSAAEAQSTATNQIYPRDQAILTALPGLIKTDQAYAKILGNAPLQDVEDLLIGPNGAIADVEKARANTDKDHPVQIYLIQAQLAAYRNYTVALYRLNGHATVPPASPVRTEGIAQLKELDRLIKLQKPGPSGQDLVNYWARLCGLPPP
jgi:hypothetical protein